MIFQFNSCLLLHLSPLISNNMAIFFSYIAQKVKSSIKYRTCNPEWNEELTLSITNMMNPVKIVSSSCAVILISMGKMQQP